MSLAATAELVQLIAHDEYYRNAARTIVSRLALLGDAKGFRQWAKKLFKLTDRRTRKVEVVPFSTGLRKMVQLMEEILASLKPKKGGRKLRIMMTALALAFLDERLKERAGYAPPLVKADLLNETGQPVNAPDDPLDAVYAGLGVAALGRCSAFCPADELEAELVRLQLLDAAHRRHGWRERPIIATLDSRREIADWLDRVLDLEVHEDRLLRPAHFQLITPDD